MLEKSKLDKMKDLSKQISDLLAGRQEGDIPTRDPYWKEVAKLKNELHELEVG